MAVPKRRQSRSRRNKRRSHQALTPVPLVRCSNCSTAIRPHHTCSNCGFYRGRQVIVGKIA
ncbi:MAG: 50S ribosomal protein L32 [Planctomycetota bacterium]